jgi:ABC-type transport system involved in multi-copper enzyme maturation permease subunit
MLRELRRNFRSVKGIILSVIALIGGTGASLLLVKFQEFKRAQLADMSADDMMALREKGLAQVYEPDTAKSLASSPEVLFAVLMLTIWLTPLIISMLGYDTVASDVQYRSVRYWSVRSRRWSYFLGKFVGLFLTISAITLAMHTLVWIVCIARGEATAAATFGWGARFWVTTLPMSAAWCAIATFISSLFRVPIWALLVTMAGFFGLWLLWVIGVASGADAFTYIYPNTYDKFLLSPHAWRALTGVGGCAAIAAVALTGGMTVFARKDI